MRKLTAMQWIIVLLTFATALIHIFLGVTSWGANSTMGAMFVLDGIGYIVIVSLLYFSGRVGRERSTMRWILILYTALTVILYFVINGSTAFSNIMGLVTKGIEVLLIILLILDRGSDAVPVVDEPTRGATTSPDLATVATAAAAAAFPAQPETSVDETLVEERTLAEVEAAEAAAAAAAIAAVAAAADKADSEAPATRAPVGLSRAALDSYFGDIDKMTVDEWRASLMAHLTIIGDISQFNEPIEYIEGIGEVRGRKWRAVNITKTVDLLVYGATRKGRAALSKRSGFEESQILTWANQVDLYRIVGVGKEYGDLLEQSGVDTVVELAGRNAAHLQKHMVDVNEKRKLVRRTPTLTEVESWIAQAANLPRVIHY